MERETVVYRGKKYHRYPESDRPQHRKYFYRHDKANESPVALHRQIYEDNNGPIPEGHEIHHKDNDYSNNDDGNLECLTTEDHRAKHPFSEETIRNNGIRAKEQDQLGVWRRENPELAREHASRNGKLSTGLADWRENNAERYREQCSENGKKVVEIHRARGTLGAGLVAWRSENPELASKLAKENGKKGSDSRKKKPGAYKDARKGLDDWRRNNPEEARRRAVEAGKKSGETRRANKAARLQSSCE